MRYLLCLDYGRKLSWRVDPGTKSWISWLTACNLRQGDKNLIILQLKPFLTVHFYQQTNLELEYLAQAFSVKAKIFILLQKLPIDFSPTSVWLLTLKLHRRKVGEYCWIESYMCIIILQYKKSNTAWTWSRTDQLTSFALSILDICILCAPWF